MIQRPDRPGVQRPPSYAGLDPDTLLQLHQLLARPDPLELRTPGGRFGRGAQLIYDGAPDRFKRWLPIRMRAIRAREVAALGLRESEDL